MAYSKKQIEDIFNEVCERIENKEALRTILKEDNMPSTQTFYRWIDSNEDKSKQYARACQMRADAIFDEMIDIADDQEEDVITIGGKECTNHNVINRARLRIDTRKWMLSKLNPKKYGDKVDVTSDNEKMDTTVIVLPANERD